MNFYEKYVALCAANGVKPSRAAMEMNLSKSAVTSWKSRGTSPTSATQQIIANYFRISVAELMDFEGKEKAPSVDEASPAKQELLRMIDEMDEQQLLKVTLLIKMAKEL